MPLIRREVGDQAGAIFSDCGLYRYALWRRWDGPRERLGMAAFIGLNPSTATESVSDPTVTRCVGYAKRWGFAGMYMLNAFALRSTDPRGLLLVGDAVGPENNRHLLGIASTVGVVVAAWGTRGKLRGRQAQLIELLGKLPLLCLGTNRDGSPRHPLYLRADERLREWE